MPLEGSAQGVAAPAAAIAPAAVADAPVQFPSCFRSSVFNAGTQETEIVFDEDGFPKEPVPPTRPSHPGLSIQLTPVAHSSLINNLSRVASYGSVGPVDSDEESLKPASQQASMKHTSLPEACSPARNHGL